MTFRPIRDFISDVDYAKLHAPFTFPNDGCYTLQNGIIIYRINDVFYSEDEYKVYKRKLLLEELKL